MVERYKGRRIAAVINVNTGNTFQFIIEHNPMNLVSPYMYKSESEAIHHGKEYIDIFITKEKEFKPCRK